MSDGAGDFKIPSAQGHDILAVNCIRVMLKSGLRAPQENQSLGNRRPNTAAFPLLDYATVFFSEHVFASSGSNDRVCQELYNFLKLNVLMWIERVAGQHGLHILIRTAANLMSYADRWSKYNVSSRSAIRIVSAWATDLSRISFRFGRALIASPQSIYFLIPPLCPTKSAIYTQFFNLKQSSRLILKGPPYTEWDDCVAHIKLEGESFSSIATGSGLIAVGMYSGNIIFFDLKHIRKRKFCDTALQ
jgi:hypothetical protein